MTIKDIYEIASWAIAAFAGWYFFIKTVIKIEKEKEKNKNGDYIP